MRPLLCALVLVLVAGRAGAQNDVQPPLVPAPESPATVAGRIAGANALVVKPSAGQLAAITITNLSGAPEYLMLFDATAIPPDGNVRPLECMEIPDNPTTSAFEYGVMPEYTNGIVAALSSTGCTTKTTPAGSSFISATYY